MLFFIIDTRYVLLLCIQQEVNRVEGVWNLAANQVTFQMILLSTRLDQWSIMIFLL